MVSHFSLIFSFGQNYREEHDKEKVLILCQKAECALWTEQKNRTPAGVILTMSPSAARLSWINSDSDKPAVKQKS